MSNTEIVATPELPTLSDLKDMGIQFDLNKDDLLDMVEEEIRDGLAGFIAEKMRIVQAGADRDVERRFAAMLETAKRAHSGTLGLVGPCVRVYEFSSIRRAPTDADEVRDVLDDNSYQRSPSAFITTSSIRRAYKFDNGSVQVLAGDWRQTGDTQSRPSLVTMLDEALQVTEYKYVNEAGREVWGVRSSAERVFDHGGKFAFKLPPLARSSTDAYGRAVASTDHLDPSYSAACAQVDYDVQRACSQYHKVKMQSKRARTRLLKSVLESAGDPRAESIQHLIRSLAQKPIALVAALEEQEW